MSLRWCVSSIASDATFVQSATCCCGKESAPDRRLHTRDSLTAGLDPCNIAGWAKLADQTRVSVQDAFVCFYLSILFPMAEERRLSCDV